MNKKGIAIVGMLVSLLLVLLIAGIILLIEKTGYREGTEKTEETTESLLNAVFRATGREPLLPDLYIVETHSWMRTVGGETTNYLSVTVGNQGSGPAGLFTICYGLSRTQVDGLEPDEEKTINIPNPQIGEVASVDCDNEIEESDETNNGVP